MKNRCFFILLFQLFSVQVFAQSKSLSADQMLSSFASFNSNVKIEVLPCSEPDVPNAANFQKDYLAFARKTIYDGLKRIQAVNPGFLNERVSRLKTPVRIDCGSLIQKGQPLYATESNTIILGGMKAGTGAWVKRMQRKTDKTYAPNIVFHEYLHHLKFENMSVAMHGYNEGGSLDGAMITYDVVYACSNYAFPHLTFESFRSRIDTPETYQAAMLKACAVCARARVESPDESKLDRDIASAQRICQRDWDNNPPTSLSTVGNPTSAH